MGTRIDLQYWQPDERPSKPPSNFARRYAPESISPSEQWIANLLEPVRKSHRILSSGEVTQ